MPLGSDGFDASAGAESRLSATAEQDGQVSSESAISAALLTKIRECIDATSRLGCHVF